MALYQALLFGGIPAGADRAALRWLHRQHLRHARFGFAAFHLSEAARCRRAMRRTAR
ncbi:MAG: hypothetical protein QJR02_15940 [Sinobacteraceae bacterium]|nr:hypothetical protein [Nevskiaceae bacterium]